MKSLGKCRTHRTHTANTARRSRKSRRQKTRKVGGDYGLRLKVFKDIGTVLDKLLEEMKVILREETYEAFMAKTNEFKALNERLHEKAKNGSLSSEDISNYKDQYIAWRDLLDHPVYNLDTARLREMGAFDERRKPKHNIYILNKIIARFVDEVVNQGDPVLFQRNQVEHDQRMAQARQRLRHRQREYQEELARDRRREREHRERDEREARERLQQERETLRPVRERVRQELERVQQERGLRHDRQDNRSLLPPSVLDRQGTRSSRRGSRSSSRGSRSASRGSRSGQL